MAKVLGVIASVFMPMILLSTGFRNAQNQDAGPPLEFKRLITDSPWAKPAGVRVKGDDWAGGDNLMRPANAPAGAPPVGTDSGGPVQRPDGGADPGSEARSQSVVRWDSAFPVRDACAKAGLAPYAFSCYSKIMIVSGQSEKFDALAKDFYILTVSNYPKAALPRRDQDAPQHSSEANAALERLGERLKFKTL